MLKKVIVLNNLPSNILSEAILILKEEIDVKDNNKNDVKNVKIKSAIDEAQYIIEKCMYNLEQASNPKKNVFAKLIDKVKGEGNKY